MLLFGVFVVLFSFFLSFSRFLNCLIVVENFNVLLLFFCLLGQSDEVRVTFLALMVIFTVEVMLGLVVLTRLWWLSDLTDIVGR